MSGFLSSGIVNVSTLPDSAIAQYDAINAFGASDEGTSPSTWPDSGGTYDLSAQGGATVVGSGINGKRSVDFDGSDDYFTTSITQSQPLSFALVTNAPSQSNAWWSGDTGTNHPRFEAFDSNLRVDAGTNQDSISSNYQGNNTIFIGVFNGTSSVVRENGSEIFSGDLGTDGITSEIGLGAKNSGAVPINGLIGEFVLYSEALSSEKISDEEQRLADKWGITI